MRKRAAWRLSVALVLLCFIPPSGIGLAQGQEEFRELLLPRPRTGGVMSLEEAIAKRLPVRRVSRHPLSFTLISKMLWASQGITHSSQSVLAVPFAGARYPLRVYVLLDSGYYRYEPSGHKLIRLSSRDLRHPLWKDVYGSPWLRNAPVMFLLAADYRRSERLYGTNARRVIHIEAGRAAEDILLQGVALGLDSLGIGAFHRVRTRRTLELPFEQELLYVLAVGKPLEPGPRGLSGRW